jgi:hypothetical protein
MTYLWAALRTIAILAAICISLFILALLIGWILAGFAWSSTGGCFVLASVFGIGALFGIQLTRVAKTDRAKFVGGLLRLAFGFAAALSLVLCAVIPYEFYLWTFSDPVFKSLGLAPSTSPALNAVGAFLFMDVANGVGVVLPVLGALVLLNVTSSVRRGLRGA